MSAGSPKRTRSQRVAALELPPGKMSTLVERLRSGAVVLRLALAAITAVGLVAITRGWAPPRDFYLKQIPSADVVAATEFRKLDERATSEAQARARRFAEAVYDNDPVPLEQLRAQVENEVSQLAGAESFEAVDQELWQKYSPPLAEGTPSPTPEEEQTAFDKFRSAFATEEAQLEFGRALQEVFAPLEQHGVLDKQPAEANAEQVVVRRGKVTGFEQVVPVRSVLIDTVRAELGPALDKRLGALVVSNTTISRPELRSHHAGETGGLSGAPLRMLATQRLLEALRQHPVARLVYASSSSAYGDAPAYPVFETDLPRPRSPYGVTKLAAEQLCVAYAANFGISSVSLRYFTVYGPRQRPDMATNRLIAAARFGTPFPMFGDGSQIRDFTFVGDVVAANLAAVEADVAAGSVFNVAGGDSCTLAELIDLVGREVGSPVPLDRRPAQPGDVFRTGGDITAAVEGLGWHPTVSVAEGVKAQVTWALANT